MKTSFAYEFDESWTKKESLVKAARIISTIDLVLMEGNVILNLRILNVIHLYDRTELGCGIGRLWTSDFGNYD